MPYAIYDKFHKFLQLPPELRLKVYDYAFGNQEIVSTLDTNGKIRIHHVDEDDHHDRGEWTSEYDNCNLLWYTRTVPPLLLSCRQIHDEAEPVLYNNTLYTFTMSDLHDPKVGPMDISHFLPRMKHVSLCLSIFEVYEWWYSRYGTAWIEEWCVTFFKLLVTTKMPNLISFSLEMKISHSNCFCIISPEANSLDDYPDPLPMPNETFQGILNAWATLRFNGRVNFEGIFGNSFSQYGPGHDFWFRPFYAGFWNDFGSKLTLYLLIASP